MPLTYRIDAELGILYAAARERVTPGDLVQALRALRADPGYRPGMHALADCRSADESSTSEEIRMMADSLQRNADTFGPARCAVVLQSDVQYGMFRIFEAFAGDLPIKIRPFRAVTDACAWLEEAVGQAVPPP